MGKVRAVAVDSEASGNLSIVEVEAPSPTPREALIRVSKISLNGASTNKPFCDGTHSKAGFEAAERAVQE